MSTPSLRALAVAALQAEGRLVRHDDEAATFTVLADRPGAEDVLGVVFEHSQSVVLYYPWEIDVPDERMPAMLEFIARANVELATSALELNVGRHELALRAGVEIGDGYAEIPRDVLALLVVNVLDEVELSADLHDAAVAAVVSGTSPRDAMAMVTEAWSRPLRQPL